jgi:hypothetical protein
MSGWIYCLTNPSMPNLVKVGQTSGDPHVRALQLYTTGVPSEFKVEFAKYVTDHVKKEAQLHMILAKSYGRPNLKREFFACTSQDVFTLFELIDGRYLDGASTPDPYDLRKYENQ